MREIPEVFKNFKSYKLTIQNRSIKTVDEYLLDLDLFFRYIIASREGIALDGDVFDNINVGNIDIEFVKTVTTDEIYEFFNYTVEYRNNKAKSRARKLSAIKSFFKYLTNRKLIDENPAISIESPSVGNKSLPKYLTVDECIALLDAIKTDPETKTRERDYAIITLFLNCGMRLSELVGISLNDIDRDLRSLRVVGKGSKERVVYLNDACKEALKSYLKVRAMDNQIEIKDKNALFLSSRHQRISNKTVQHIVYKYLRMAGLEYKRFSTHKLRHTAATLMYQTGKVDVRVLKDILGHEQLNTTQIYTHVSDESMEKAMSNNPLNNIKK
ncbi:MAG: tyrosine recombinase XerC [Ruminococcaceae bacterium]|nr:tyrosine recombinase XerC [Oscillospiraceae bacterium]